MKNIFVQYAIYALKYINQFFVLTLPELFKFILDFKIQLSGDK